MSDQTEALTNFAVKVGIIDPETAEQIKANQKPPVIVPGGVTSISESAEKLYREIAPSEQLFLRDGNVCQLIESDGVRKLELLKPAAACSRFEDFVRFLKPAKTKDGTTLFVPEVISKETAEKYLTAGAKSLLPPIEGLLRCPLITERHGKIHIVSEGYDPTTKLLITETVKITDVPFCLLYTSDAADE